MKTGALAFLLLISSACKDEPMVYVCLSKNAHRYHLNPECPGFRRCTYRTARITEKAAKDAGRTLCHLEGGHDELIR